MKKHGILNSDISRVLSYLRHTDSICIADCGLPVPDGVELIDLSVRIGDPSFMMVLKEIRSHMVIEKICLAEEIKSKNPYMLQSVLYLFEDTEIEYVSHEVFKVNTQTCKAITRTGEATPYSNIILQAGCLF